MYIFLLILGMIDSCMLVPLYSISAEVATIIAKNPSSTLKRDRA